jgi:tetratricopeptide (TPR) repeat protein
MPAQPPPVDDFDDMAVRGGGKGKWVVLLLLLLAAAGAGTTYLLKPELIDSLMGAVPELALSHVTTGYEKLEKGSLPDIEGATEDFNKAVSLAAKYAEARAALSDAHLAHAIWLSEDLRRLEVQEKILEAEGEKSAEALKLAQQEAKKLKGEIEVASSKAFASAKEALVIAPNALQGNRSMAAYYGFKKASEQMKSPLAKAQALAPKDPKISYVLGRSTADDPTAAERSMRYFDEALEIAPNMNAARYELARMYLLQGNKENAKLHAEAILKTSEEHAQAKALLVELEPPKEPEPEPEVVAEPAPKKLTYEQLLSKADRLRDNDRAEQALDMYEKATEMEPDDPDGHVGLGWAYLDLEQNNAAIMSFKRALEIVPRFTDAHLGLGEAYAARNMKRDAIKHFKKYLEILPGGPDAPVAKRMLQQLQQ